MRFTALVYLLRVIGCSLELNIRQRILADIASNDDGHFAEELISEKVSTGFCSNDGHLRDERTNLYMVCSSAAIGQGK